MSWEQQLRTCMHGIQEKLDSHSCTQCLLEAQARGKDVSKGQTYLYTESKSLAGNCEEEDVTSVARESDGTYSNW